MQRRHARSALVRLAPALAVTLLVQTLHAETSTRSFYGHAEITLPERSRAIDAIPPPESCVSGPGRHVDGCADDWTSEPTAIAGTARYDRGEWIWTDYPYDDDGTGTFAYPGEGEALVAADGTIGKATTRNQRYGANAADVVEVRAAADADTLFLLVRFNFLNAADSTVVGLGLDLDGDPGTGFSAWPLGARLSTPGMDLFITAWGADALVTTAAGSRPIAAVGGSIAVGTRDNVFEIALPRSLLAGATTLHVVGGSGLWDPAAGAWMPVQALPRTATNASDAPRGARTASDPAVWNLLFRGDETTVEGCEGTTSPNADCQLGTPRAFQSARQHAALRGGTNGGYAAAIDLGKLLDGATDPLRFRRVGGEKDFTRVYRSRLDAEGVLVVANNVAVFLGRYQPYAVYLPACFESGCPGLWPAGRPPLVLLPHGGGQSHLGSAPRRSIPEGGTDLYGAQTIYEKLEATVPAAAVRPLGRGQRAPWWRGVGEADFLEVLEDVERRYGTDPERRVVVGASLGGYSTIKMASLYPDLWSGAFAHCPAEFENSISARDVGNADPTTQPFVIDPVMPSLLNVPFRMASGTIDPLVPIVADHRLRDAALAAGLDLRYTEYLLGSHCFDLAALTAPWIGNHNVETANLLTVPRATRPARIRYRIDPRQYLASTPKASEPIGVFDGRDAGIVYEGAYWLSGLAVRPEVEAAALSPDAPGGADTSVVGAVEVASRALPGWQVGAADCGALPVGAGFGVDGNPELEPPLPTPHFYECRAQTRSGTAERTLELEERNLATGTVDVAAAGLAGPAPVRIEARGDGPFTLTLAGLVADDVAGGCTPSFTTSSGETRIQLTLSDALCTLTVTP